MDKSMERITARIKVGEQETQIALTPDQTSAAFTFPLNAGPTAIQTWLVQPDGREHGAYFVYVEQIT